MARSPSDAVSQFSGVPSEAPSGRQRRMSMEEDMFYRDVMTSRPAKPPSYESAMKAAFAAQRRERQNTGSSRRVPEERLPAYSSNVNIEGVFMRKMEIEEVNKRAEYRDWRMVYVELRGTALNVYSVKKERGWFSKNHDGPDIAPDKPPWVKKSSLERSYSLLHADAGIAADYKKRRYVIRLRVENDQFLLSCIELGTFVTWLDRIFAAINVAAPIDDRQFPRDYSIPRLQRIRWLRGQRPTPDSAPIFQRLTEVQRRESDEFDSEGEGEGGEPPDQDHHHYDEGGGGGGPGIGLRYEHPIIGRLSTTSYPNENVDPDTGKWIPQHPWTVTHDRLYARLCYQVLLFKSPRKSRMMVTRGKEYYVDWESGRTLTVLPPAYGETNIMGPWQVIHAENRRI
ncbi:hypothetical protein QBC44DRAFT_93305 [Cladorrhinum sp. PSN332]|nr:hypothetical protein QBC44DRAFT_93305 [Cladorrhinum sp. PSN332]